MKYFLQAVKEGGRHWPSLVAAFLCSLGVAALWGANIAALFPIIETTLSGKSPAEWNVERMEVAEASLEAGQQKAEALRAQIAKIDDPLKQGEVELELKAVETRIEVDRATIESGVWVQDNLISWMPNKPFTTVVTVVVIVLLATVVRVSLLLTNAVLVAWVSQSIVRDIRGRVFGKALELDPQTFDRYGISGIQAFITHSTDMLAYGITNFYSGAITEPLRIISCLCGALYISWQLTLTSMLLAPFVAFLTLGLNRKVRGLAVRILDRSLGFHHIALDVLGAHQAVQANTMEEFERNRFRGATGEMRKVAVLARFYEALASPLTEVLGMGMLCTGLITSSYLVLNQETAIFGITMTSAPLSVAAVTVFLGMLIGAADPLRKLSRVIGGINNGMAAANVIYPMLNSESHIRDPEGEPRQIDRVETIAIDNIHFTYDGQHQVLTGANVTVNAHERLAIVGSNGTGKSTLVNLICRFYDPQQGRVLINGHDAREFAVADLRSRFAVVSQKTELFNETLLHNIRYGRWDATEEEVIEAARRARAHDFIAEMAEGYNTIVGSNGHRLSGGQRQRVALARAFLRGSEVLILDEATSQIDVESERLIHEALAEYGADRTILFITHRESTLSLATRIVRVQSGQIVDAAATAQAA